MHNIVSCNKSDRPIVANCTSSVNQITHKKMELLGSIVVNKFKCSE